MLPIGAAVLLAVISLAVLLNYFPPNKRNVEPVSNPDAAWRAEVDQITKSCAMGMRASSQSEVRAGIADFLKKVYATTKVTSDEIGAVAEKITPTADGVALYKGYSDCLKQQLAIAVARRGIKIGAADQADLEARRDEEVLKGLGRLSPDTPASRLVELIGQPIEEREQEIADKDNETADTSVKFVRYNYKNDIYVTDVYDAKNRRLGLAIQVNEPAWRIRVAHLASGANASAPVILADVTECGSTIGDNSNHLSSNVHGNIMSGQCGGSHSTDYVLTTYIFRGIDMSGESDEPKVCASMLFSDDDIKKFDAHLCPRLASAPASIAIFSRDSDNLDLAAQALFEELNYR